MNEILNIQTVTESGQLLQLATENKRLRDKLAHKELTLSIQNQAFADIAPLVDYANALIAAKSACTVGEFARIVTCNGHKISQRSLYKWLRDNGYFGDGGKEHNRPKPEYVERGLFVFSDNTVMVTAQGQKELLEPLLNI